MPFELPSVGPRTSAELQEFESFEQVLQENRSGCVVGWVIRLHMLLLGKEFITAIKQELQEAFGMKIRNMIGWAVCLFFVNQVSW